MKIGILTLPLHVNYGGILQAYALQTILESMGHEVLLIEKEREYKVSFLQILKVFPKRLFNAIKNGNFKFGIKHENTLRKKQNDERCQYMAEFIKMHIKYLKIKEFEDLSETMFDALVVGSDQVWRPKYANLLMGSVRYAFFDFAKTWLNVKRISYAASFGTSDWEYNDTETKICKSLIGQFNAVSVRETSGIRLCREFLGLQNVVEVLDPTLLLDSSVYKKLFVGNSSKSQGDLFCYVLDDSKYIKEIIKRYSKENNLTPFYVNISWDKSGSCRECAIQPPVEQWLRGFYDAKFVITDSFHACVFSILFRKQFLVVGNKKRGLTRFQALLGQFNLTDRLINHTFGGDEVWPGSIELYMVIQKCTT